MIAFLVKYQPPTNALKEEPVISEMIVQQKEQVLRNVQAVLDQFSDGANCLKWLRTYIHMCVCWKIYMWILRITHTHIYIYACMYTQVSVCVCFPCVNRCMCVLQCPSRYHYLFELSYIHMP